MDIGTLACVSRQFCGSRNYTTKCGENLGSSRIRKDDFVLPIATEPAVRGSRDMTEPPWQWTGERRQSPILVFYSFKGGVGRSTALASFAIQRARVGERVVVIDFDLDAPGVGVLLAADKLGTTASWGGLDYLLERAYEPVDLRDYYHACRQSAVTQSGEILVFPAGCLNGDYLGKLARVDFEMPVGDTTGPLVQLLHQVRDEFQPDWILLDTRTGLSESSGMLLGGLAPFVLPLTLSLPLRWLSRFGR